MGKRADGEGGFKKHANGGWEARLYVPKKLRSAYGGKERLSFYAKTQAEAGRRRDLARREMEDGRVGGRGVTLGSYLTRWLAPDGPLAGSVAPRTHEDRRYYAEKHLIPKDMLGGIHLSDLTAEILDDHYYGLVSKGIGIRTINHVHETVRVALSRAVKKRLIPYNPARDADPPRYSTAEREYATLDRDGLRAFFEALDGDRYEALFVAAALSGARPGELRALNWADLDLPDVGSGEAHIRRSVSSSRSGSKTIRNTTKTGKGRTIYLFPEVVSALKSHHARQSQEKLSRGTLWEEQGLVFPDRTGGIVDDRHLRDRHLRPALKKAGLQKEIRLYDLRHTFATLWVESGEDPKVLQLILGHSRIETTLNLYTHLSAKHQKTSFERFGASLGNDSSGAGWGKRGGSEGTEEVEKYR